MRLEKLEGAEVPRDGWALHDRGSGSTSLPSLLGGKCEREQANGCLRLGEGVLG